MQLQLGCVGGGVEDAWVLRPYTGAATLERSASGAFWCAVQALVGDFFSGLGGHGEVKTVQ